MDLVTLRSWLLLSVILAPLLGFIVLAFWAVFAKHHSEFHVVQIARISSFFASASLAGLIAILILQAESSYIARYHSWFSFEAHHFDITFSVNTLSLGFLVLTVTLSALVAKFSKTYIHLEQGFTRFYLLLLLATFGMTLVVVADSLSLTVVGWEFLGISSALLIAFFHARKVPVTNALRTFIVYRIGDVGLLLALMYAHSMFGTTEMTQIIRTANGPYGEFFGTSTQALILGLCFFLSASGKSSTLPFFPWLGGAMEGPTPSSAIFYGAFAVHAGPYLFLRYAPLVSASPALSMVLIFVGLFSAVLATISGRIRADVKTALAFATITQVSLIYVEIGLHWYYFAAFHTAGHMCLRTYQFLRAPSALHDLHVRSALGVAARERGVLYSRLIPQGVELWLYRLAFEQGAILSVYQWLLVQPFLQVGNKLSQLEVQCDRLLENILGGDDLDSCHRATGESDALLSSHCPSRQE